MGKIWILGQKQVMKIFSPAKSNAQLFLIIQTCTNFYFLIHQLVMKCYTAPQNWWALVNVVMNLWVP